MNTRWIAFFTALFIALNVTAQNEAQWGNKAAWETARLHKKTLVDQGITKVYCSPLPEGGFNMYLHESNITNLALLRKMSLRMLTITKTPVCDLSPLQGNQLDELNIIGTKVTDLSPLKDLPLVRFGFDPYKITKGLDVVRGIKTLSTITFPSKASGEDVKLFAREFWERLDAGNLEKPPPVQKPK